MTDGYDVENRLSSQHDENSNIYSIQEEITEVKFDDTISLPRNFCEKPPEDSPEKIILDPLYIISTGDTNNPINDNTNENNENNKNINSDNYFQNENYEYNKEINTDNYYQNENNKNNKDINSDNHFQINQNTINKKRKRNIISEEKKKMGRKKKASVVFQNILNIQKITRSKKSKLILLIFVILM